MRFLLFLIILLTCGCGFHPRGYPNLAPALHRVYIKASDPYGRLARDLRDYFKMSNITLADSASDADTTLEIVREETGQQLLSVGGTQQTRQYNLTLTVIYRLLNAKGVVLVDNQIARETRALTIQSSQILGGSNEANAMYDQMRRAIVYDIENRLSSNEITALLTNAHEISPATT